MKRTFAHAGLLISASAVILLAAAPVFAEGRPIVIGPITSPPTTDTNTTTSTTNTTSGGTPATGGTGTGASTGANTSPSSQGAASSSVARPPSVGVKLTGPTLTLCNTRSAGINDIMNRIVDRGQQQLTLFGSIATRVETFYTSSGKTVSNYMTLVAAINTDQTAAQSAVATLKDASATFSCSTTDPQATITTFKTDLQNEIAAMQTYRTAVKNLIDAILTVVKPSTTSTTTGGNQ